MVFLTLVVDTAAPAATLPPPAIPPDTTTIDVLSAAFKVMSPAAYTLLVLEICASMVVLRSFTATLPPTATFPEAPPPTEIVVSTSLALAITTTEETSAESLPISELSTKALMELLIRLTEIAAPTPTEPDTPSPPATSTDTDSSIAATSTGPVTRILLLSIILASTVLLRTLTPMVPAMPADLPPAAPTAILVSTPLRPECTFTAPLLRRVVLLTTERAALSIKLTENAKPTPADLPPAKPPPKEKI